MRFVAQAGVTQRTNHPDERVERVTVHPSLSLPGKPSCFQTTPDDRRDCNVVWNPPAQTCTSRVGTSQNRESVCNVPNDMRRCKFKCNETLRPNRSPHNIRIALPGTHAHRPSPAKGRPISARIQRSCTQRIIHHRYCKSVCAGSPPREAHRSP